MNLFATIVVLSVLLFSACSERDTSNRAPLQATNAAPRSPAPASGTLSSRSYADVVEQVSPAVVTIRSSRRSRPPQQFPFMTDPFFRRFFGDGEQGRSRRAPPRMEHGLGSGVIVRADGHILTNHHVVDGADEIKVDLKDRRTYSAELVGSDAPSDLAVLRVGTRDLPALHLADSDRVRVGDICLALGNPLGIGQTVTSGIISAKGRSTGLSNGSFEDFLQTDAAINQGNSGGALVNMTGELIGINSQILSPTGGNIGIGFAIPSNMAQNVMKQLLAGGRVRRGQLGVSVRQITTDVASTVGLKDTRGVLIESVAPGGPADKAGIRPGDVVTAINGTPVDDANTFRNQIASTPPGTTVRLSIVRDGREQQVNATLGELKAEAAKPDQRSSR